MKEILYFMNQNFFWFFSYNADNKIWVLDADSSQIGSMEDHTIFKSPLPRLMELQTLGE